MNDKKLWELISIISEGQDSEQRRQVEQYITDLQKEIERLTSNWNELKQFINTNCFYDGDTITYEELCDKIMYLENKGSDKK